MSVSFTAPIARLDNRVRVAATLLRSAPRREHLVIGGMALTSAASTWPFQGALYPAVAIPAVLALAALIRQHLDGLDARRDALVAAGATFADTLVIQITGPFGAASVGVFAGSFAAVVLGHGAAHAVVPLAISFVAALPIRRRRLGAPALAAGSLGALMAASAWTAFWPIALAAALTVAAAQAAVVKQQSLKRLGRRLAAAAERRLIARSGA